MISSSRPLENRMRALGLRLFAISCLSIMVAMIKLASEGGTKLPEIMFWRQAFAVPVIIFWVTLGPGFASLRTGRIGAHVTRSAMGTTGMMFNFGAVILLPLAEATTISFTVPIFATILSAIILKEQVGRHRWVAVLLGFVGVLVVVQPGVTHFPLAGAATGLTSAIMIAIISLQLRDMGRTESAITTVFWFSLLSTIPLGIALPFFVTPHDGQGWLLLCGIGAMGAIGQVALTASLRYAPVSTVVGMDYIALVWASFFGWMIWDQLPVSTTWIGAPIIIGSGLYIAWREHRLSIERTKDLIA